MCVRQRGMSHCVLRGRRARRRACRSRNDAPGPCRGEGRYCLAHIRAQREPIISPAGPGDDYRQPRRVSLQCCVSTVGRPFGIDIKRDEFNQQGRKTKTTSHAL